MRKILALAATLALVATTTASAITFGEPDGNRHPNVGALVADWNEESPGPDEFCSGTLVSETLLLTAAHCMVGWEPGTDFWVTFSPEYDEDAASPSGLVPVVDFTVHESFGQPGGGADAPARGEHVLRARAAGRRTCSTPSDWSAACRRSRGRAA